MHGDSADAPVRSPRSRLGPRPPAAPGARRRAQAELEKSRSVFTGAAPPPLPADIGPGPPRVSGRGVTRPGAATAGRAPEGALSGENVQSKRGTQRKPTMARTDEVAGAVRSPHGSRGAVTEQPGRLTGQKRDTGGSPVTPRDPPGCSSSGVAFGLPLPLSRLIPFSRALPGVLGGGCKEFMREQTGARWDPKGVLRAGALQGSKSPKGGQELCLQRYLEALARPDPACHTGV